MRDPKIVNAYTMFKGSVEDIEIEKYLFKEEGVSEIAIVEINTKSSIRKRPKLSSLKLDHLKISNEDKVKLKKVKKTLLNSMA